MLVKLKAINLHILTCKWSLWNRKVKNVNAKLCFIPGKITLEFHSFLAPFNEAFVFKVENCLQLYMLHCENEFWGNEINNCSVFFCDFQVSGHNKSNYKILIKGFINSFLRFPLNTKRFILWAMTTFCWWRSECVRLTLVFSTFRTKSHKLEWLQKGIVLKQSTNQTCNAVEKKE